ncbi:PAS domain S-box protein [Paenibacillus silvisoli]|uniref:PAS domain S-box protein n=1 Tax=Paenibacillus silvisoli TaxID=3110539 RepID=UPI002805C46E|nr:PAS domain S-box protein [Paenibacillus silvisoli]
MKAFLHRNVGISMLHGRLRMLGIVFVLLVGLVCAAIFSAFELQQQKRDIHHQLDQTISLQKQYIDKWMSDAMSEIGMIARLPAVKRMEKHEVADILEAAKSKHKEFRSLALIDKDGYSALSDNRTNLKDRSYFIEAQNGNESISDVLLSRLDGKPIIVFAAPVYDESSRFIGAAMGVVDLATIDQLMKQFSYGKQGETYLVGKDGKRIAGDGAEDSQSPLTASSAILERAREGTVTDGPYTNDQGVTVYGTYQYVNQNQWLIVGEAARRDVYAALYKELMYVTLFLLLAMAAAVFVMLRTARKMAQPLRHLMAGVKLIKDGGYSYRIDPALMKDSAMEFQQLCRLFNSMSDTIVEQIGALRTERNFVASIIETAASLVVVVDRDGRIIQYNQSSERISGYAFSEVQHRSIFELFVPEGEHQAVRDHFANVLASKGNVRQENHWRTRSGELRLIAWSNTLLISESDGTPSIIGIGIDVTEQRAAERAMMESEERIRTLVGSMDEIVSTFDAELKLTGVYGRSLDAFIQDPQSYYAGKTIHELLNADNAKLHEEAQRKALQEKNSVLDWSIKAVGGTTYHQTSYSPLRDMDGQVKGVLSVSREVTQLKQAEEAFKETQACLNNILESITDAFMALNNDWSFAYVNSEAERILGKSRESIIGRQIWECFPKIIGTEIFAAYRTAMDDQVPIFMEEYLPFMHAWYGVHIYPSREGLSIYFQNVTERKELEQAAKDSENWLSTIIDTVPNAIVVVDSSGQITMANRMAEGIFALEKESILSRTYSDDAWTLYNFNGELVSKEDYPVAHVFRSGQAVFNHEFIYQREDRSTVMISVNVSPVKDGAGGIASALVSITDITNRFAVESKLQQAYEELKKLSSLDGLTGVFNRRYFNEQLALEWQRHMAAQQPLSLIMLDIDYFKLYNDTYGHQGGDVCLKAVASDLQDAIASPGAFVARYGGEEFSIVLPNTAKEQAARLAELVRGRIESKRIPHSKSAVSPFVTISLGAATVVPDFQHEEEALIASADKCLYEAKKMRNRVAVYELEEPAR